MSDRLMGINDAAEYLGLSVRTLKKHLYETGKLKADATIGKTLVFRQSSLDKFKSQRSPTTRPSKSHPATPPE